MTKMLVEHDAQGRLCLGKEVAEMAGEPYLGARGKSGAKTSAGRRRIDTTRAEMEAQLAAVDVDALQAAQDQGHQMVDDLRRIKSRRAAGSPTDDLLALPELDGFIGLERIRDELTRIAAFVWLQRQRGGLTAARAALPHLVFAGPPGTGKTTVAQALGAWFKRVGALEKGLVVVASRADLVAHYIGHTAGMVNEVADRALGGILFIDEAYSLVPQDSGKDFGPEAIATLFQRMENDRGKFVCIAAGYPGEMDELLSSNPGLRSRFSITVPFSDYTEQELLDIIAVQARAERTRFSASARSALPDRFARLRLLPDWANARSTREYFRAAVRNHALRIFPTPPPSRKPLRISLRDPPPVPESVDSLDPVMQAQPADQRRAPDASSNLGPILAQLTAAITRLAEATPSASKPAKRISPTS